MPLLFKGLKERKECDLEESNKNFPKKLIYLKVHIAQIMYIYMYIKIVNQFVLIVLIQILIQRIPVMYLLRANQVLCAVKNIKND